MAITSVQIEDELKESYLDYSMSVIVSRALPNVHDGFKPVHRRILYSMYESGFTHDKPFKKCARIVGSVLGLYHAHGDNSVYDALVRMAQPWNMSEVLIDSQGNFGSTEDPPAAMRYTEARMNKLSESMLEDIGYDVVPFVPNYDESTTEPTVLPARFPNLLVNGSTGIAVGFATEIPPHNLSETINGVCAYIDNNDITLEEMMIHIPGPDLPTGGTIKSTYLKKMYSTGRGSFVMTSVFSVEEIRRMKKAIVITEIPYQVNKKKMIEKIAELIKEKRLEGISDIRDESSREGIRVVIELKPAILVDALIAKLLALTPMQVNYSANMLCLVNNKPEQLSLLEIIKYFVEFRKDVITKRSQYLLKKAQDRLHILLGLVVAVTNIDDIITIIKNSKTPKDAKENLMKISWDVSEIEDFLKLIGCDIPTDSKYILTDEQATAILDLKLNRLTNLETTKLENEMKEVAKDIKHMKEILENPRKLMQVMKHELQEIKSKFGRVRRTVIE